MKSIDEICKEATLTGTAPSQLYNKYKAEDRRKYTKYAVIGLLALKLTIGSAYYLTHKEQIKDYIQNYKIERMIHNVRR